MSNKALQAVILILSISFSLSAELATKPSGEKSAQQTKKKVSSEKRRSVAIPAINLSGFRVNYEQLLGKKRSAVMVDASILLWDIWGNNEKGAKIGVHYRMHTPRKERHKGLVSPYWGPFITYLKSSGTDSVDVTIDSLNQWTGEIVEYSGHNHAIDYDFREFRAGIVGGQRWALRNGISFDVWGGLAANPLFLYDWHTESGVTVNNQGENGLFNRKTARETILRDALGMLEFGFTIGYSF